ncbi:hypothetical protein DAPPUDRAFT_274469 [Daphnia pulex]|uniref:Peptidase A2 domain-containing protein n=1 Tax=Daphnia pulex TaxID=6669 RepID=E9I4A3_DAPPU|nr:hypothetical protein DAPPUDRAFT_274469 [Daphnia pulex]|eukprot:EFX61177.1 hypothetical protein DAPPUDRAFT_274469 [Daphnia pulex]
MTLDAVLNKARAIEAAVTQADRMEKETDQKALIMRRNRPTRNQQQTDRGICSFCGCQFHQRLSTCPARFHQCSNCLNIHHFEQFYRSSRRERSGQSSNIILKQQTKSYHPTKQKERTKGLPNSKFDVSVNNVKISVIADSGSTVTILDRNAYDQLGKPKLAPTSVNIDT